MGSPSESLATLRPDLGGSLEEFSLSMDRQGFIALQVFPVIEVDKASGTFGKVPLEELLKDRETRRNPRGGYGRGDWEFEEESFLTREHGWEETIDDNEASMYADFYDAELMATEFSRDTVMRKHEMRVAAALFDAAVFSGRTTAVSTAWTVGNAATAVPLSDVEAAAQNIYDDCGLWPNAVIFNRKVARNLRQIDNITDAIASAGAGSSIAQGNITRETLRNVFDLNPIVGGGTKNTAAEGQTASVAQIWSTDMCLVARIAETDSIREPCLGRTFHWGADGSDIGGVIETYRDETVRGEVVRARHQTQEKLLYVEAGHLLTNINGGTP